jgi:pimeloyl-ACP methyl ester carboxylesterase
MTKLGERVVDSPEGRTLGVAEWGDPSGVPVFNLHGTPGSRLGRHHDEAMYDRLGMRLITYDRPGYGVSERRRGRCIVHAVDDIVSIADALGIGRFVVGGNSGGAPHALACAALLGDRVLSSYAAVPVAPYEPLRDQWIVGQAPSNVREFSAATRGEDTLVEYLGNQVERIREDPLNILDPDDDLSPRDRSVLARESVLRVFGEMLTEALRHGPYGWVDDDLAFLEPWGFDMRAIEAPVLLAYGHDDTLAPKAHGEYLAAVIPGVEVRMMDAGHLSAMDYAESNWARVLELANARGNI